MIILDFGSGETCKNDTAYIERMIDELAAVDTGKEEVVIKWQLFKGIEYQGRPLVELLPESFNHAYFYATKYGYKTTASVFDMDGLLFISSYVVPFIKVANRNDMYYLIKEIHATKNRAVVSVGDKATYDYIHPGYENIDILCCVSDYPANPEDYRRRFGDYLYTGMSDHTSDFALYKKYRPELYECHYKLEDSTGLDAGPFARTPAQLKEVL